MKRFVIVIFLLLILVQCTISQTPIEPKPAQSQFTLINETADADNEEESPADTVFVIGDINGDNITDTAFIDPPLVIYDSLMYEREYIVTITFSCNVPALVIENSIGGFVLDITDLDDDGKDEIIYVYEWLSSCWGHFEVQSYSNNRWHKLADAGVYWCGDVGYASRVNKISKDKFEIIEDAMGDDAIMKQKKRVVKIRK